MSDTQPPNTCGDDEYEIWSSDHATAGIRPRLWIDFNPPKPSNSPMLGDNPTGSDPEISGARPLCGICGKKTRDAGILLHINSKTHRAFYCSNCNAAVLGQAVPKGVSAALIYSVDVDKIVDGDELPSDQEL